MDPNTETNIQGNQFYKDTYHSVSKSEVSTVRSTIILCITKEEKMLMVDIHQLRETAQFQGSCLVRIASMLIILVLAILLNCC